MSKCVDYVQYGALRKGDEFLLSDGTTGVIEKISFYDKGVRGGDVLFKSTSRRWYNIDKLAPGYYLFLESCRKVGVMAKVDSFQSMKELF